MSEFRGFKCDECGNIIEDGEARTKQRVRFEGPSVNEEFTRDLCGKCTKSEVGKVQHLLSPIKRRQRRTVKSS